MQSASDPIAETIAFASENDPPQRTTRNVIERLRQHQPAIVALITREKNPWTPTALARKLREAGVKVSETRLQQAIRDIAGIPKRGTINQDST